MKADGWWLTAEEHPRREKDMRARLTREVVGSLIRVPRSLQAFHAGGASFPWRSHAAWIVAQMLRWGEIEKPLDVRAAAAQVYWTELHREIAAEIGAEAPASDEKIETTCPRRVRPASI